MARVDEEPEERHQETVKVTQNVECPECDTLQDVIFDTGVYDIEMLDDEIGTEVTCVNKDCGFTWEQQYEGWSHHTDAG